MVWVAWPILALMAVAGCRHSPSAEEVDPGVVEAAEKQDAMAVYEGLEALIERGKDSPDEVGQVYRSLDEDD